MDRNHPANNVDAKGDYLEGKNVWVGITGSVSCVETDGMIRELLRYGANVTVVANRAALELVGEKSLEFACGKPVIKEITGQVEHVIAGHEADLLMITPCCATSLGKMVNGIGDNPPMLVALTCIGAKTPMIVAPAMDQNMAKSEIVKKNLKAVKKFANVVEPVMIEGKAKLPSKERLVAEACKIGGPKTLDQKKILVIGGGSCEPIDDVRIISNKSSGFMAVSLAECAFAMGASVNLWLGNSTHNPGEWIKTNNFESISKLKNMVIVTLSGFESNNPLSLSGDINLWLDSKAYNIIETVHQFWMLSVIDLIIGSEGIYGMITSCTFKLDNKTKKHLE